MSWALAPVAARPGCDGFAVGVAVVLPPVRGLSESYGWQAAGADEIVLRRRSKGRTRVRGNRPDPLGFLPESADLERPCRYCARRSHALSNGDASLTWLLTGHFVPTILSSPRSHLADGPLTVYDLERIVRPPEWIVLSACEAGRSEVHPGDELMGTSAALLSLGTRPIVSSAAAVPDDGVIPVMIALHEQLVHGYGLARALATAQARALPEPYRSAISPQATNERWRRWQQELSCVWALVKLSTRGA